MIKHDNSIVLLVQNDFDKGNIIEQQMFDETIKDGSMLCIQEKEIKGINALLSRRKMQAFLKDAFSKRIINDLKLYDEIKRIYNFYEQVYILFLNTTFASARIPYLALKKIKELYPNVQMVLFYIDSIERPVSFYANYLREKGIFDSVYTFDKEDSGYIGAKNWLTPYSVFNQITNNDKEQYDLYFCGVAKDRMSIISEICNNSTANIKMDIFSNEFINIKKHSNNVKVHKIKELFSYWDVLNRTVKSKCILDIVREGQSGLTLRPYEAVCYNKKLLTNNPYIYDFPFFDERYMKFYKRVSDIDWDWVKDKKKPSYNYNGEFSPKLLVDDIKQSNKISNHVQDDIKDIS